MELRTRALAGMLVLSAAGSIRAEPAACQAQTEERELFLEREALIARYEQLPEACLKTLFRHCSRAASQDFLDGGTAAHCSMGYEALLRRSFGGNFNALMAWWRSERVREPSAWPGR